MTVAGKSLNEKYQEDKMFNRADVAPVEDGFLPIDGRVTSLATTRSISKFVQVCTFINFYNIHYNGPCNLFFIED